MVDKIKVTKTTNSFGKTSKETVEVSGEKLAKQLNSITAKLGYNEKTLDELTKRIEKQRQLSEANGNKTFSTKDYLDQIRLEQATLGLSRQRLEYTEFLHNYEKRIKELNKEAYKDNSLYKAYQAVKNEHNSMPTAAATNIGLAMATGGAINPVIAQALHLDKLITAPISAITRKLLGIGHTTSSAIKNEEDAERNEMLKKISDNVEGIAKKSANAEVKEKEEGGFFSNLLKAAAGIIGTGMLLSNIPGIPDWAKDYLPWAVGGFVFGGVKGLLAAVILKFGWNKLQEFMGNGDDLLNTSDTIDEALGKFAKEVGVSPRTVKVALGGAIAGLMMGGIKGALAGAIIALAGDALWGAYQAKDELENQFNENSVGTGLRVLGQGTAEQAKRNGASPETVENLQKVDDAVALLQSGASSYTTAKLLRHPLHPKGMAPYLTYAAGGIETAATAQKQIDKDGGAFDGINVGNALVGSVEQSWEETFKDAGKAYDDFSNGEILSGLYHTGATVKDVIWDDFAMGAAKLGGSVMSYTWGGVQKLWNWAFGDDDEEPPKPVTTNQQAVNPYAVSNIYDEQQQLNGGELSKRELGFLEKERELLTEGLKEVVHDPDSIGMLQLSIQQDIRDELREFNEINNKLYLDQHNYLELERNNYNVGIGHGGVSPTAIGSRRVDSNV